VQSQIDFKQVEMGIQGPSTKPACRSLAPGAGRVRARCEEDTGKICGALLKPAVVVLPSV